MNSVSFEIFGNLSINICDAGDSTTGITDQMAMTWNASIFVIFEFKVGNPIIIQHTVQKILRFKVSKRSVNGYSVPGLVFRKLLHDLLVIQRSFGFIQD